MIVDGSLCFSSGVHMVGLTFRGVPCLFLYLFVSVHCFLCCSAFPCRFSDIFCLRVFLRLALFSSTEFHMVGLVVRPPCFIFVYVCVRSFFLVEFGRFPRRFPGPMVLFWLSYGFPWLSMVCFAVPTVSYDFPIVGIWCSWLFDIIFI